jgi:hypothetical protein
MQIKDAVRMILRAEAGRAMHTRQLRRRLQAMGIDSAARDPESVIDTSAKRLRDAGEPVEWVATKTFRWVGPSGEEAPTNHVDEDMATQMPPSIGPPGDDPEFIRLFGEPDDRRPDGQD